MGYFILVVLFLVLVELHGKEIEKFICDKSGRFENPSDPTCESFYLCSFTIQGDLVQTQYSCPDGSIFSPQHALCSRNYTCQRSIPSDLRLIDTEKKDNVYYHCQDGTENTFKCLRSGKFADLLDSTCKNYHLCALSQNGQYLRTKLQCPEGTLFDPNSQKCHTKYECPCDRWKWKKVNGITLNSKYHSNTKWQYLKLPRFSCKTTESIGNFKCKKAGKFADERDVTCTDYIICSKVSNGKYVRSFFSCTHGSAFDPISKKCSAKYECSCQIETSTLLTKPTEPITNEILPTSQKLTEFVCKRKGRFPNRSDVSCSTYYLCEMSKKHELKKKEYRCPRCLYFNPELAKCTDNYLCPCKAKENQEQTTESSRNQSSTIDTSIATDMTTDCTIPPIGKPFGCSSRGRFPDRRDTTCRSYFLCTNLRRNIFRRTSYQCQRNLKFDPTLQRCSAGYECPCINTSITTSSNLTTISSTTSSEPTTTSTSSRTSTSTQFTTLSSENPNITISSSSGMSSSTQSSTITTRLSTTTTDDCRIPPISRPFRCTSRGRFPDRRDPTCASYFICSIVRRGIFRRTSHQCLRNLRFDPSTQRCSARYECPCINTSITTSSNLTTISLPTTQRSTTSPQPTTSSTNTRVSTSTQFTTLSSENPNITRSTSSGISSSTQSSTITTRLSTTTTDDCRIPPISRPFRCTSRGRFPDRRDPTCASYFICSIVRRGIFRKTSHQCLRNLRFDPSTKRCSARYECPCINTSITTSSNLTTVTLPTTQRSTTSPQPTTSSTSTRTSTSTQFTTLSSENPNITRSTSSGMTSPTQSSTITTRLSTITTDDCRIPPISRPFRCTSRGRFPDRRDLTCASYFICSIVRRGIFRRTSHQCLKNLRFDPSTQRCSARYECPCINTSITTSSNLTTISLPTTQRSTNSPQPTTSSTSNRTSTSTQFTTLSSENPNITRSTSSGMSSSSQSSTITTRLSTTTTDDCKIPPISRPFRCTSRGRFPDRRDPTCASYFICSIVGKGIFRITSHQCLRNLRFDPSTQRCSARYECPCINTSITTSSNLTTVTLPTTQRSTTSPQPTTSSTSTRTPTSTQFTTLSSENPNITRSTSSGMSSSTQSSSITTRLSTTTTDDCRIPPISRPFRCTSRGRFPDRRDPTCASYFICSIVRRGFFRRTSHQCLRNLRFDPSTQRCSARYECPCINTSITTSSNLTTISLPTTQRSTTSPQPTTSSTSTRTSTSTQFTTLSSENPNITRSTSSGMSSSTQSSSITTRLSTTTTDDCRIPPISRPFRCTSRGRFPDRRDPTCASYFICSIVRRGIFRRTSHQCLKNLRFDPSTQRCSARYECPCINTSITTSSNLTTISLPTTQRSTNSPQPTTSSTSTRTSTSTQFTTLSSENPNITRSTSSGMSSSSQSSTITTRLSTTTTDDCRIPPISRPFRCTSRGRFPDRRDPTCASYFICSIVGKGIFRRTSHQCLRNLRFDPSTQRCSARYECPCINTSITTSSNLTTVTLPTTQRSTTSPQPTTSSTSTRTPTSTQFTTLSSENPNITRSTSSGMSSSTQSSSITTRLSTTTTDDCRIPSISRPFRCTSRGRFPDRRDPTCASYFICSIVRRGIFRRTSHQCLRNLRFDPSTQRCSARFECPCINTSITTSSNLTTVTLPSTQRSTTSPQPTTSSTSTRTSTSTQFTTLSSENPNITRSTSSGMTSSTQSSTITTRLSTITTDDCRIPPISRPFRCTSRGRFPDRRDPTCASYFICSIVRRGIFRRTSHQCLRNLRFDPSTQRCSARYECPCINTSITTSSNLTTISLPTTQRSTTSPQPTTSSTNTRVSTSTQFTTLSSENPNITRSTSSGMSSSTQSSTITTRLSTTTTDDCRILPISRPFRCTSRGRFPDRRDPTCASYFICSIVRRGIFRKTSHQCLRNLRFDPSTKRCSARYECPCINTSITTSSNLTTVTLPTTQRSTTSPQPTTSSTSTRTSTSTQFTTLSSENPNITRSTSSGMTSPTQSSTITTRLSTITTDDCRIPPISRPFRCTSRGRFPDRRDLTCASYFICSIVRRGIFRRTSHQCLKNLRFDPSTQRCSARYECPCINTSITTSSNLTTISLPTTQRSTNSPHPTTSSTSTRTSTSTQFTTLSSENPNITRSTSSGMSSSSQSSTITTRLSTTTTDDCRIPPISRPFRCTSRGRFPDRRDPTCASYFICSIVGKGIFRRTSHQCLRNLRFDPSTQRCSARYECPCINTSITTSSNLTTVTLPTTQRSTTSPQPTTSSTSTRTPTSTQFTTLSSENPNISRSTSSGMSSSTQSSSITTRLSTTTTDDCRIPPISRPFRCTSRGRFPDRRDPTCASYFICSIVRRGIFRRTSHQCLRNLRFDPSTQRCSARFECPCINTSITTSSNLTTVTLPTTQRSTTSPQPTTSSTSTRTSTSTQFTTLSSENPNITRSTSSGMTSSTQSSTITTRLSTITTDDCRIPPISRPFRCTSRGRFPDRRDHTCASYFICSIVRRGIFRRTSHQCLRNLRFDPSTQRCSARYECPCINTSITTSSNLTTISLPTTQSSTTSPQPTTSSTSTRTSTSTQFTTLSSENPNITRSTSSGMSSSTQSSTITTRLSTTTTDDCKIPPISRPFRCTSRGRFPDRRDPTCASYFICSIVRRGIFRRTSHQCLRNLRFDPSTQRCSDRYECPCINTSITTSSNLTTVTLPTTQRSTTSPQPTTSSTSTRKPTSTQFTTLSSENPNITRSTSSGMSSSTQSSSITTRLSTTTTDDCRIPPISRPFRCTSSGRFPDRRDPTCASYFICSIVRRGIFRRTSHQCLRNLRFDPSTQRCSARFECPCINTSITTSSNLTTVTLPTTQRSTTSPQPTISSTSTRTSTSTQFTTLSSENPNITRSTSSGMTSSTQSSTITTRLSTITTDDCRISPISKPFRCTSRGRFPDRRDPTCASYFICSIVRRGIFRRTSHQCLKNLRFDPSTQRCSARYECPCINTSITTSSNLTTISLPTTQGSTNSPQPTTSSTSTRTSTSTQFTTLSSENPNITRSTSSGMSSSSQSSTITTRLSTTTTDDCRIPPISRPFRCTSRGRFPDRRDPTCASYFICSIVGKGIFRRTSHQCLRNLRFDPSTQRCSARYECPCINTSITTSSNLTTVTLPTTQRSTTSPQPTTSSTSTRTPTSTQFTTLSSENPNITRSTSSGMSSSTQSSSITIRLSTTTTDDCRIPPISRPFRCTSRGRFPDRRDPTCASYFICSIVRRGIFRRTSHQCLRNLRFDPSTQRCSARYECPCINTSITTSSNLTTISLPTTQRSTTSPQPTTSSTSTRTSTSTQFTTLSSENPNITRSTSSGMSSSTQSSSITTRLSTTTTDDCRIPPISRPFRCTSRGRFPDRRDPTCASYFICSIVRRGIFRRTSHQCLKNLRFDPSTQRCSARYECPCINTSITTSSNLTTISLPTSQRSTISPQPTTSSTSTRTSTSTQFTTLSSENPNITRSTSSGMSSSSQSSTITTRLSTTTTDDCRIPPISRPFRCTSRGRFPDRRDPTCASYFICSIVGKGIFRRTSHQCLRNLRFDPSTQRCSARYECPCINTSITTSSNLTTVTLPTTQRSTTSPQPTTSSTSTRTPTSTQFTTLSSENPNITRSTSSGMSSSTQSSSITTRLSTTTTDDCRIPPISRPFRCTSRGRFPDRRDPTCASYFICSIVRRGIFRRTSHQCLRNLRFDPSTQRCSARYECPCINTSITTSSNLTTISLPTTQRSTTSPQPTTSSTSTRTSTSTQFTTLSSENPNITRSTSSGMSSSTQSSSITTRLSTTTTDDCRIPPISRPFRCTSRGRFPDRRDPTCASYFICSIVRRGIFRRTSHQCLRNLRFDPSTQRCSAKFECPCINTSITTSSNLTTVTLPTTQRSTTSPQPTTSSTSTRTSTSTQFTTLSSENPNITRSTSSGMTSSTQSSTITTRLSTITTDDCRIPPISRPFRCKSRGRFPDRRDPTCASYFICSFVRRDVFRRTSHQCFRNLRFDPSTQRCSARYECPCINTSTTTSSNLTTVSLPTTQRSTTSPQPTTSSTSTRTSTSTQFTTLSSENSNITRSTSSGMSSSTQSSTITTRLSNTTTDDCRIPPISRPFRCTSRGHFPDRRDPTCASYFICSIVRRGIFRRTSHQCLRNLRFDPSTQRCSARYECPCINTSITTSSNLTTVTLPTTQRSTTSPQPTTSSTSTRTSTSTQFTTLSSENPNITRSTSSGMSSSTQSSSITTRLSTATTDDCRIPPISRPFRCTSRGRFPDRRDPTCASYFICSIVRRGIFRRTSHQCLRNLRFDPSTQRCSARYECPCINTSITTSSNLTTISLPTTQRSTTSPQPTTSSTSTRTSTSTQFTTLSSENPNITRSTSSGMSSSTQSSTITTRLSTTTTDDCRIPPISRPFRCTSRGRFPDRRDPTCASYFICSIVRRGIFRRTSHQCLRNLRFDPSTQRCSARYECTCINTSITTSSNLTTVTLPTTQRSTTSPQPTTSSTSTRTPTSTQFTTLSSENPNITRSTSSGMSSSTQSSSITTRLSTTTTDDCRIPPISGPFRCTSRGRFPDRRDPTCASYFICSIVKRDTFRRTSHQCLRNLRFDPSTQRCTVRYKCPCINTSITTSSNLTTISLPTSQSTTSHQPTTSSTSTRTSTSTEFTTLSSEHPNITRSTSSGMSSSTQSSTFTTRLSTTTTDDCRIPPISRPFRCKSRGRFPDRRDPTCASYFICSLVRRDIFRRTSHQCFRNLRFDPSTQRCSARYECLCINTSTTTSSNLTTVSLPTTQRSTTSPQPTTSSTSTRTSTSTQFTTLSSENPNITRSTSSGMSSTTQSSTITTRLSTTTTDDCRIPSISRPFRCTSRGRFPDRRDPTCASYFICSIVRRGIFRRTTHQCLRKLIFDPSTQRCSAGYKCPCINTSTTISSNLTTISLPTTQGSTNSSQPTSSSTSTRSTSTLGSSTSSTSLSTTDDCSVSQNNFICTDVGRFRNAKDLSCCTYYSCSLSRNGTMIQTEYSCPERSKFHPKLKKCTEDYSCPCSVTESMKSFTPSSIQCDIPTEEFVCTSVGRFPNRQDVSCCNYILCSISETGSFIKFEYSCPEGKSFDPERQRCSKFYRCPCIITEISANQPAT